jgi:hypothetical protein
MTTTEAEATQAPAAHAEKSSTRGGFLRALGLAAGAAVAGQLVASEAADAADGGNTVLGNANTAAHQTSVSMTPSGTPDALARSAVMGRVNAVDHYGVTGQGVGSPTNGGTGNAVGVWGDARTGLANLPVFAPQNRWGVLGTSDVVAVVGVAESSTGSGIGVNGYSSHPSDGVGVYGQADGPNGTGVYADASTGSGGVGIVANGTENGAWLGGGHAPLWLVPRTVAGPPTDASAKGEVLVDSAGVMWLCTADGTPGTWIRATHGGSRLLASPQRAYSSTDVGTGVRMNRGETRTVALAGAVPGVPANALGVILNLTLHQTINAGFVTAFPAGGAVPATSSINWFQSDQQIANGVTIGVGTGGGVSFYCDGATGAGQPLTQIIVDVTGYIL